MSRPGSSSSGEGGAARSGKSSHRPSSSSSSTHGPHRPSSSSGGGGGGAHPVMTRLGLQNTEEGDMLNKISTIGNYTFTVPPANRFHSHQSEQKFIQLTGSMNPVFNADRFDTVRQRLQTSDRKEREAAMQSIAIMYTERLSKVFAESGGRDSASDDEKGISTRRSSRDSAGPSITTTSVNRPLNYAEIERMFYPTYAPDYFTALKALGLPRRIMWRPGSFTALENLSRVPLERCTNEREAQFSFEEWYSLFWNYYNPFTPLAFVCLITAQTMVLTRQLVDGLADYIAWRHSLIEDGTPAKKAPILYLGPRIGKYGALLNATKKIPVPIIHAHPEPNTNPYLLAIPTQLQSEFRPNPIHKMNPKDALDKYEPAIVLLSEMGAHKDETAVVRASGSVREYMCVGIADSYVEGSGWDTWGFPRLRPRDAPTKIPPFITEGWGRLNLDPLSRWVLHRVDSEMEMGLGSVVTFMRRPTIPPALTRMKNTWLPRLRPPFY